MLGVFPIRAALVRLLPRKTISWLGLTGLLVVLVSIAQTQPGPPLRDGLPRLPRLTLTAQDEYVIRENLLTDSSLPRQGSAPDTIGDVVPQNIKLYPLASPSRAKSAKGPGVSVPCQGRQHGDPRQFQRSARGRRHKKEIERLAAAGFRAKIVEWVG